MIRFALAFFLFLTLAVGSAESAETVENVWVQGHWVTVENQAVWIKGYYKPVVQRQQPQVVYVQQPVVVYVQQPAPQVVYVQRPHSTFMNFGFSSGFYGGGCYHGHHHGHSRFVVSGSFGR